MIFLRCAVCVMLGAALLLAGAAGAEEASLPGATLDGVRARLIESNPELQAMALEVQAMRAREMPAGALPDPQLEIEWRDIDGDDPTLDPSDVGSTKYQFQQRFPLWGKRGLARDVARARTGVADAERRARALELLAETERAYVRYWHASAASTALERVVAVMTGIGKLATARYRQGIVPMQDSLQAQVELTLMEHDRIALDSERRVASAELNGLLGRAADAPLAVPREKPELAIPWRLDYLMEQLDQVHPQVLAALGEVETAARRRKLSLRNRYPDLTLSVAPIQRGQRVENWELMIGVEIPLQQGRRRAEESEARLLERAAELQLESVRTSLRAEAAARYAAWQSAEHHRGLVQDTLLVQTEASWRAARAGYAVAEVDFMTLLDALRAWRAAELSQYDVSREALESAAGLRALIGSLTP